MNSADVLHHLGVAAISQARPRIAVSAEPDTHNVKQVYVMATRDSECAARPIQASCGGCEVAGDALLTLKMTTFYAFFYLN